MNEGSKNNTASILNELETRTLEHPDKLLYAFLDINGNTKESYTYKEFQQRINSLASHIYEKHSFLTGDRVLLLYPPGLEMICAFFSCVRLGLIPVPVYPPSGSGFETAVNKMNFIAGDCGAKMVLTDNSYYWSLKINLSRSSNENNCISGLQWIMSDEADMSGLVNFPALHSDILFLQYTSGSTSDPKGVIVTHSNMISNCNSVVDHTPIGVSWLPQYHDMGLIGYYIFFALKGGTTYGFSPIDFIQRPALWLESISKYSATASSAPNFAYEYCLMPGKIPDRTFETLDLSSLKFLMTAAEPVRPNVYEDFLNKFATCGLQPKSFFAAYGLAEFTLAVSNYGRSINSFDAKLLKKNKVKITAQIDSPDNFINVMSCGKVLGDTKIKIVDVTAGSKETETGDVGEIWVRGSSKCAGYWNREELTKRTFEAKLDEQTNSETWLRTGDLGFMYKNELYVCGRLKDMIIIRGLNYYPQDIESTIEEDACVRKGCVAAFSVEKNERESLVVVIGLKNNKKIPDTGTINSKIIKQLGIGADTFVFVPARTVSKTSSAKIMRSQNKERFLQNDLQVISKVDLDESLNFESKINAIQKEVNRNERDHLSLFSTYGLTGAESESPGDAGLDSLKLAEFAHDIKKYLDLNGHNNLSHEVDLRLLQKIAVSELFEILKELKSSSYLSKLKFKNAFARIYKEHEKIEMEKMKRDACCSVQPQMRSPQTISGRHILLTGGTGFFGPFLLKSLLEQNKENIYVIVRAKDPEEGKRRLREAFSVLECTQEIKNNFEERIKPVCGDIARANLGLTSETWNFLAENIHTIYNNGAQVNYLLDYESVRKANVNSTTEIIRLAMTSTFKTLNHISTTFIFGWSVKDTLFESDSNENMENLDFGYSQSKWVSEKIVANAIKQGLNARIFRPALISPSISGEGYNFDISIRLLAFMVKHGIGTSAKNQVSFTPADIAANNIIAISNIKESAGFTFHVTRDEFSSMSDVTKILGEYAGGSFTNFPLKDFVPEVVNRCNKDDLLFPLLNFLVRSESKISAMEFKRYNNTNYTTFRDRSAYGKKDPSLDEVVKGIFLFMLSRGIIEEKIEHIKYV